MKDEQLASEEVVLKEYPHSTRWLEGQEVIGVGNLILTNQRLVFLHRIPLDDKELEYLRKFSAKASTSKMIDLAFTLHKKNFQVPLSSVISVKTGLYSLLPFPRPRLHITYQSEQKKKQVKTLSFLFTIPLLRGVFQWEITTIMTWVRIIREAVKYNQLTVEEQKTK